MMNRRNFAKSLFGAVCGLLSLPKRKTKKTLDSHVTKTGWLVVTTVEDINGGDGWGSGGKILCRKYSKAEHGEG